MLTRTPEIDAEVRRNLLFAGSMIAGGVLLFVALMIVAVGAPSREQALSVGMRLLGALSVPMALFAGLAYTLARPMECWPAFIRARRLPDLLGVDAASVSNPAMRGRMRSPGYWAAFARGLAAGLLFVLPWLGFMWAIRTTGFPTGLVGPAGMIVLFAAGTAARAWVVRRAAEEAPRVAIEAG
ncbi:hypothetical protein [Paludisphaera mucosa]|uniref:DUF2975 domain-containing protein n=1 Tax=Paludisphaera mucosa TaxID=3030827 RepID=A0ABT6FJ26_9BACT|nr:hypothetical protein [Paludisphaera mucosa]MDG3007554.1 hypothetical protein [Paludisphaera mucosa]